MDALKELEALRAEIERRDHLVLEARRQGATWQAIAYAIGMSISAVQNIGRRMNGGVLPQPRN